MEGCHVAPDQGAQVQGLQRHQGLFGDALDRPHSPPSGSHGQGYGHGGHGHGYAGRAECVQQRRASTPGATSSTTPDAASPAAEGTGLRE
ncbi:hypothetical protein COCMIDRAFT_39146 [Bipolaris oryzae ATCC 44560]|uniref:Uncharacterized protein n=1 Tax=Bipolaris oryzae ATCC 44560 TaxID=930090 RepID=W6YZ37_COCMI|nr:uncharacterized protein COCMIDRAFT_39146 [Bipolaris oryzae ATCC 44560]EUC42850.1 hypothetical protein COCMIDRAFT_39146 [Bipolaris oryzae ATCC 44560]